VEQEPPEKLFGGNRHQPLLALVSVVLPAEGDLVVGKVHNSVVGYGDAMRVAGQVMKDMFGPAEGSFGVDHPILTEHRPQESMEGFLFSEPFQASRKEQLPVTESVLRPATNLPRNTRLRTLTGRKNG